MALTDFEDAMRLNEQRDGVPSAEALADIGYAQMELGNAKAAVKLLKESVQRFASAGNVTFVLRAKKRLALAYLRSFQPNDAARELNEAYDLAQDHRVFDQIAPIME